MITKALHQKYQILEDAKFLPGTGAIGAGYNVFGEFANPNSITTQLFDWNNAPTKKVMFDNKFVIPDVVSAQETSTSEYVKFSGESIESFQSNLNIHTKLDGSYKFFSGSLESNFNSQELRKARNEFTMIQQDIEKWSLKLDPQKAKSLLLPEVKKDLDTLPPDELFNKYGTHFLTGILIGGKATFNTSTNQTTYKSSHELEVISELSYQSLTFQISNENRVKYGQDIAMFNANSSAEIKTIGGLAELGGFNITTDGGFKEWSISIGENPTFIDFTTERGLTPIWELVDDATRKQDLVNAYKPFAQKISDEVTIHSDSMTDILVIFGDNSSIEAPTGYTKYPFDLNRNARGKYIYFCYKMSSAEEIIDNQLAPIVGLDVILDNNVPTGFIKDNTDLNKGHGGEFVYLCYKKGVAGDINNTIKDIFVVGADYSQVFPPEGFVRINQDCNAGAGGDYIYLCYSTIV